MFDFPIKTVGHIKYVELNYPDEEVVSKLLLSIRFLDLREIDVVVINKNFFNRECLEFKNGKFNYSKAMMAFTWIYHEEILNSLKEGAK